MKKLKTGREVDESSLSHTKWNCMYHIVFIIIDLYFVLVYYIFQSEGFSC